MKNISSITARFYAKTRFFAGILGLAGAITFCNACTDVDSTPGVSPDQVRVLIANEGQYMASTSSLSAVTYGDSMVNDVFRTANARPLGDIAKSILGVGNNLVISVGNSGKLEVISKSTFRSIETIRMPAYVDPSYMCYLGGDSMAVSKGYAEGLAIVDTRFGVQRDTIKHQYAIGFVAQMKMLAGKLFMTGRPYSEYTYGGQTYVYTEAPLRVATLGNLNQTRQILWNGHTIVPVGESKILEDPQGKLWVLTATHLLRIDPNTETVISALSVGELVVDEWWSARFDASTDKQRFYFTASLNGKSGIARVSYNATSVPQNLLFEFPAYDQANPQAAGIANVYNMAVSPDETIFICDVSYVAATRGYVKEYNLNGSLRKSWLAGIYPQFIYFMR